MTLIIGIKCQDGIVLGADGLASYGTPLGQEATIKQQTVKKLSIIGESLILGVAGPVGLGQSFAAELREVVTRTNNRSNFKTLQAARDALRASLWKHAKPAWEQATIVRQAVGPAATIDVSSSSIVAVPILEESAIINFSPHCLPEHNTDELPFISIGSGQTVADPFLAFIRRVFWPDRPPTVNEGVLSAIWTLQYSIHAQTYGIGEPLQVVTLKKDGATWRATELSQEDLGEHIQMIETMEEGLRSVVMDSFNVRPTSPIPELGREARGEPKK